MEARTVATLVFTLCDGLFVRRAVLPDFNAGRELRQVVELIGALVSGDMPARAPETLEPCR